MKTSRIALVIAAIGTASLMACSTASDDGKTHVEEVRSSLVRFLRTEQTLTDEVADTGAVLQAIWRWLAASRAGVVLLNVEDLWLETESQNTPNTYVERPNWRRKLRHAFEQFTRDPTVLEIFREINDLRSATHPAPKDRH